MPNAVRKTISLPAELAQETEEIARSEGKSLSAVVQEALRLAGRRRRLTEYRTLQGHWSRLARERGLVTDEDLARYLAD